MVDDAYTRNEDGELAVRTVSTSGDTGTNPNDVFTRDDEGRLAIRTTGGGGDQHNLGYFATLAELQEAYPTGEAGDWAIVAESDTVYIWDDTQQAWVDTDQKGQVTSVNNQTGAVTVSEVPSQTGNAGKFLTTDGTDASWSDKPLVNLSTSPNSSIVLSPANKTTGVNNAFCVVLGWDAYASSQWSIIIGGSSNVYGIHGIAIGRNASANSNSLAIGAYAKAAATNSIQITTGGSVPNNRNDDANTFKVGNANGNYEIMSADGTIPADRLTHAINKYSTMPTAASTNEGWIVQFTGTTDSNYTHGYIYECVTDDNTTYYWKQMDVQPSAKVNTTATLAVADWSSNTQTVTVSGVKADSVVFVSPAPASASDYASAGILCTSQGADSLTFSCTQTPSSAIVVNIVCL